MYFTAKPHYFIGNLAMVGGVLTFCLKSVIRFNDQCGELADKQLSSDLKKIRIVYNFSLWYLSHTNRYISLFRPDCL